jgi:hypothetical protein
MYNKSIVVRSAVQSIGNSFKIMWTIAKFILKQVVDSFKALGEVVEGVVTLDFDKVKNGWTNGFKALGANLKEAATDIASSTANAFNKTMKDEIKEVNIDLDANVNSEAPTDNTRKTGKYTAPGPTEKEVKEAEKHAKELLKIIQDTDDATINAMEEGHEKEIALIRQKYKKKLDEIKGNSAEEQQLRISLALAMEKEVADSDLKYQQNLAKINLENRLASVKKGSKEELDLKLAQLEAQKAAELEAAKKSGADVNIITEKYAQQRSELEINYQNAQYEEQANLRAGDFAKQQSDLKTKYAEDLKLAGDNEQKKTKITEKYEKDLAELSEKYAVDSAQAQVDMLENLLKDESLTDTQREDLAKKLAEAKTALANATADADIAATKRAEDADKKSMNKRIENAQTWMQKVTEMLNAVSGLASAIYDGKIQKIEDEEDALDEASEKEQDRITELVDNNVITEEEGEARKRAAEEKTEKKKEELEKKKANLEYKQAVWDKANSVAQCGINTALAIMKLWADMGVAALPMQAVVAALGAIQLATILATPIPKYAKGTEHHKGGLAVVGDAGKQEVVTYDGEVWLTPDTPTLVDLPAGAAVAPSIIDYMKENPISPKSYELQNAAPIIVNDYQRLEAKLAGVNERMDSIIYQLKQTTKAEREAARDLFLQQIVKNRL